MGTLLLDPYNLTISTASSSGMSGFSANANDSILNVTTLQNALATANVTVTTGSSGGQAGNITVANGVTWTSASALTLSAYGNIVVNGALSGGAGSSIKLIADVTGTGVGTVTFGSGVKATASGGVSIYYNPASNPAGSAVNTTSYTSPADYSGYAGAGTAVAAYMLVNTLNDLQNISNNLYGNYAISRDIDASATLLWNSGSGFLPIGHGIDQFRGAVDGQNHVISSLYINRPTANAIGLFGALSSDAQVRNLTVANARVTGSDAVGTLAGISYGTLSNVHITSAGSASVAGSISAGSAGGLVGLNYGNIAHASSAASVSGRTAVGGLVGLNAADSLIFSSYSTGSVTGLGSSSDSAASSAIGGLVGETHGAVSYSYATGNVSGARGVGGLVGHHYGPPITSSFATGNVSAERAGGGLVGYSKGPIESSYATGNVTELSTTVSGLSHGLLGGLVGHQNDLASVSSSYATGDVTGTQSIGGLVGYGAANTKISTSYSSGVVTGSGGGLTGNYLGTVTHSYWDVTTSGQATSAGGVGLTDAQMHTWTSFVGFDPTIWAVPDATYLPEIYGVSGVVSVYQTMTYGNNVSTASTTVYGIGAWNTTSGSFTTNLSSSTSAGVNQIMVSGLTGTFTAGGATRVIAVANVAQRPITLTVGNQSRNYGDANPTTSTVTIGGSGLANTDAISGVTVSSTALATSSPAAFTLAGTGAVFTSGSASNYAISYTNGTLTVTPATLVVTATGTQVYGSTTPSYAFTAAGWQNGQSDSSLTGLGYRTTATAASNVGSGYSATASGGTLGGAANGNYTVSYAAGAFAVTPATLVVTATGKQVYGSTTPSYAFTAAGWQNGQTNSNLTGLGYSTTATAASNVGSGYSATASGGTLGGAANGNYTLSYSAGTFSVTPATLVVTATGSQVYGATTPSYAFTAAGWQNGQSDSNLTGLGYSTTATAASNVGTSYSATANGGTLGGAANGNYTLSYSAGTFSVTPATLVVTATGTQVYGSTTPTYAFTVAGWQNGQGDSNLTGLGYSTTATAASNVGTSYSATASGGTLGGAASGNYTVSYAAGGFSVTPATLVVTATGSQVYGSTTPSYAFTAAGWQNGQTNSNLTGLGYSTTATAASNVGSGYSATASGGTLGGDANGNYTLSYSAGGFSVTPATLVVTATGSQVYGSTTPNYAFTVAGWQNGQGDSNLTGLGYSTTATAASDVGTSYSATASGGTLGGAANGNYTVSYAAGAFSVTPATLVVTATGSQVYGATTPIYAFTAAGWQNGQSDSNLTGLGYSTTATAASNVGTSYSATASGGTLGGAANGNYTVSYSVGGFSVTPATLVVTAQNATKTYGEALLLKDFTVLGLVNGDTVTSTALTSAGSGASANAGSYAVDASAAQGTGLSNYQITYASGVLGVERALLTYVAQSLSRAYGDENPSLTGAVTGFVNGESMSNLTGTAGWTSPAGSSSGVGSYAVTGVGLSSSNYKFTQAAANATALVVSPRAITVSANGLERTYGDANPQLTYSVSGAGLVNDDQLTGGLFTTADATSGVGRYLITQGSLAASANYLMTFEPGALAISARPLTAIANDETRAYGAANPLLTYRITGAGLVNGDSLAGWLFTPALASSSPGSYPILQGSLSASANYALTFVPGALSVVGTPDRIMQQTAEEWMIVGEQNLAAQMTAGTVAVQGVTLEASTQVLDPSQCESTAGGCGPLMPYQTNRTYGQWQSFQPGAGGQ